MQENDSIPASRTAGTADARASAAQDGDGVEAETAAAAPDESQAALEPSFQADDGQKNQEKPENRMIDVHAPHGGIHTWRDFWIHLGTIALGLLIAIGLEQTVEYLHHLHQRHQLEADLKAELEVDHRRFLDSQRRIEVGRARMVALRDEVDRMRESGGKLKLAFIPSPTVDPQTKQPLPLGLQPSETAWTTAKESELVGLLPRDEAEIYSRLEIQYDRFTDAIDVDSHSRDDLTAFEMRFKQSGRATDPPDMARMTVDDLNEYSILLSRVLAASGYEENRARLYDQETEAILHGARTEEEMLQESLRTPRGN